MKKTRILQQYGTNLLLAVFLLLCMPTPASAQITNKELDELAYTYAVSSSKDLRGYIINKLGVSPAHFDIFVRGLQEKGAAFPDAATQHAYQQGNMMGETMRESVSRLNYMLFENDESHVSKLIPGVQRGYVDVLRGQQKMTFEEAEQKYRQQSDSIKKKWLLPKYKDNKEAGERFMADNKAKPGVHSFPSGLQYKVIKAGTGRKPRETSKVKVHYEGKTIDGTIIDSSYKRGQASEFFVNQVIKGWGEALQNMPVGSIWEIYIPQELGYGERKAGAILPFSATIYKVELLSIIEY